MQKKKHQRKAIDPVEEAQNFMRVLYWFFAYPDDPIGLNDLSKAVEIAKTTAKMMVKQLKNVGFLDVELIGKIWRIRCIKEHTYNTTIKIPFNLDLVYASGIVQEIRQQFPGARSIILFGSYRNGDDTDKSDLDIGIEVIDDKELEIVEFPKIPLGFRKSVPVKLHIFTRNKIDLNLFANIANGIVLDGFLEVRP